jgi:4-hydroxybenzoate polyprenyltransferase
LQLKKIIIVDVIVLAGLYTLRVLAGGVAVGIVVSTWLLALSIFLFLSLAFMKRYAELKVLQAQQRESATGRDYLSSDMEWLGSMGTSSGYISVLVLALYISSKDVEVLYSHPKVLWLICPFLLYWIARMWARAYRGHLDDDPIVVAATDRGSYVVGIIIAMIIIAAL